ncbi:MAG: CDP-diacylglycerol--serine O-phosphatidyltransferase [Proteobacteria bacterium]|nr:CDP-diacylglycerol--serine O-phosphatidyltransferase [Pseudomonadota bacterium]
MSEPRVRHRRRRRRGRRSERARAVILLPNLITSAALLLGFWSIILSAQQQFERAALCIVLAAVCDMLDGRIARATNSATPFGVEYDSLSDLVSFGLAPSLLIYHWVLVPLGPRGWLIAGLFTLCAALRLARFNVRAQAEESLYYQGLPTTAAGAMVAVTVWFVSWLGPSLQGTWFAFEGPPFGRLPGALLTTGFAVLALLMVSSLPYPSLKLIRIEGRRAYPTLVAVVLFSVALLLNHEWMFFALGAIFLLSGPAVWWRRRYREARQLAPAEAHEERVDG